MTVYLNKDYEIYDADGDAAIKVCISEEMVCVRVAPDEKSKEWFGAELDFLFSVDVAEKLAEAIRLTVLDARGKE